MKLLIAALLISTSAMASDVLLHCTRTTFTDLDQIIISQGRDAGEILVTEIALDGSSKESLQVVRGFTGLQSVELSDWYGYSRVLYFDGNGWNIEHRDECGGGVSPVTCK